MGAERPAREGRTATVAPEETPAEGRGHPEARGVTRELLGELFGPPGERGFGVRYWDGTAEGPSDPEFTLHLKEPGALRAVLLPPTERSLGDAYLEDRFDVEGDMEAAVRVVSPVLGSLWSPGAMIRVWPRLLRLPRPARGPPPGHDDAPPRHGRRHSVPRDERSVRHHYDRGNEFFRLFLGPWMQYSCGYFRSGDEELAEAQEAKLELICRRLELSPGSRLLDIGCGWGGLIRYAATRHGARCVGLTLSPPQAEAAHRAIRAAGLEERCRVEVRDYRDLPDAEPYDAVASVGMVEHVGSRKLPLYFRRAFRALRPGGLFLNQGIVTLDSTRPALRRLRNRLLGRWTSFIERHVFPDGELVTVVERIRPAEVEGFELRGVQSLREHYAETLRRWMARLEDRRQEALALVGRRSYRVWRAYMAGSIHGFRSGRIGVVRELYRKP